MKYFILSGLIFILSVSMKAQNALAPVLKNYFRTHPFEIRFSSFITSLQEDPWFSTDLIERRTDSSFFFMSGSYKNFNPFHFETKEVRLIIAEGEFVHTDSLQTLDTIIYIQLLGITDTLLSGQQLVKKEYTRFQKKYGTAFWINNNSKNENGAKLVWELTNYFIYPYSISPVTVAWGRIQETAQYVFTITIRCIVKQNVAEFILPPDGL